MTRQPWRGELRRDVDIAVNVVGKAVQQDRNWAISRSRLVVGDVERTGIDVVQRLHPLR